MRKNQTSIRNGIQDLLCPFPYFGVSGGVDIKSHLGTKANDIGFKDTKNPYEPYYAPCDIKCIYVWKSHGQAMWQSVNKVRFSDGTIQYLTFVTAHDSSFNCFVGMTLKQGDQMGNKGKKGASSIHCHIECAKGLYTVNDWNVNQYGNPCFPNEVTLNQVFFFDDTELASNKYIPYELKYLKDVVVEKPILKIGDSVKIIGTGNGSSCGDSNIAYGIGWTRKILNIFEGRKYPYQVGNETGTIGFYTLDALERR